MEIFGKYSAAWALIILGLIAIYYLLRAWLAARRVKQDALEEYEYRKAERALELDVDQETYVRAYRRFHAPRRDWYIGLSGLAITILTPMAILLFEVVSTFLWKLAERPYEFGPTTLVWRFLLLFALIAFWGIFYYLVAQLYHRRRPFSFKDELRKELNT